MFPPLLLPFPCSHPTHKIQLRIEKSTELSGFSHQRHMCEVSRFSHVRLYATPWTVACLALLSMGFSTQEYWSGQPCPPPGDLLNPGLKSMSLASPASAVGFFTTAPPGQPNQYYMHMLMEKYFYQEKQEFLSQKRISYDTEVEFGYQIRIQKRVIEQERLCYPSIRLASYSFIQKQLWRGNA